MKSFALGIVSAIIQAMLLAATPALRGLIEDFVDKLEEKANATPNTIDDALVKLLGDLLKVS